ncbi:MAG: rhomboid family intramembrane serine protease [Paludibacteraceae bacterium]|nr:rhomboid family intramembrane serine protease [Paludibacteraceae bacterium]
MGFKEEIITSFKSGNTLTKLIYINLGVFLIVGLVNVVLLLFNINRGWIDQSLALSSQFGVLIRNPWTLFTYMFLHYQFIHLIINILTLYWFGKIFLEYYSQRDLVGLYIFGGLLGGLLYFIAYATLPLFQNQYASLCGASAAIMAIIVACAYTDPERSIRLVLFGNVKVKWLAVFAIVVSLLNVASENAGGNISHLGGALGGFFYVFALRKGKNLTSGINKAIDSIVNLFKRNKAPKMKVTYNQRPMTDQEYNYAKRQESEQIDIILDKIKKSGYDSLSKEERDKLFTASRRK